MKSPTTAVLGPLVLISSLQELINNAPVHAFTSSQPACSFIRRNTSICQNTLLLSRHPQLHPEKRRRHNLFHSTAIYLSAGKEVNGEATTVKIVSTTSKKSATQQSNSNDASSKAGMDANAIAVEDPLLQIQQQWNDIQDQWKEFSETSSVQLKQAQESWESLLRSLAALSLKDYEWRSEIFKERRADRALEESLARMRGESASYVRPMYADEEKMGPLGKAEKQAVEWLYEVIEEEAKRARVIADGGGKVIRPLEMAKRRQNPLVPAEEEFGSFIAMSKEILAEEEEEIGPLAALELKAVEFLKIIKESETERATLGKLRPMDLEEAKRGPLGSAEANLVSALEKIKTAERARMEQSRQRGGVVVRPIDVPGPLGEIEKAVLTIVTAEKKRAKEGAQLEDGKVVRPMEASIKGPLGSAERIVSDAVTRVNSEERERLRSFQRYLEERRPMENNRDSVAGFTEALIVGISRGPRLFMALLGRVKELVNSEPLPPDDQGVVKLADDSRGETRSSENDMPSK